MRKLIKLFISLGLFFCCHGLKAQERSLLDSLCYRAEVQTTLASGDHNPLWLNANKYGLSSLKKINGYLRGALERPLSADDGRKWGLGYGADLAVASGFTSKLIVQQAFVEGRWLKGTLTIGSKEYPMELKNNQLSSGSQALGINARPVPQVRLALPDYWVIPGIKSWLALKGHIAYGKTTDDNWQKDFTHQQSKYTEGTLYHSKAGYLRIGPKNITLEVGMEMACQFGGKSFKRDGPLDDAVYTNAQDLHSFWSAFIPVVGKDVTDNVYSNAEGNHLGSWVARLNFDYRTWNLGLYADHFFEDNSSMLHISYAGYGEGSEWDVKKDSRYFLHDFKDWLLGAELKLKDVNWLNDVVVEYMYTKYQGGPLYHDHTPAINEHICGRDHFYNHSLFTGWQHWGQVMGNPLYLSPLYNEDGTIQVKNNRFLAWHLGLSGNPIERLNYRILTTWQRGYGNYHVLFMDPEENVSLLAEASYQMPRGGWQVKAAFGMDSGKIYGDNIGCQLTVVKTGLLNLNRK